MTLRGNEARVRLGTIILNDKIGTRGPADSSHSYVPMYLCQVPSILMAVMMDSVASCSIWIMYSEDGATRVCRYCNLEL